MDERWSEIDVSALFARATQPVFLLNERGRVVYANPALHDLFKVPLGNRVGWREWETGPLRAPIDLPPGEARQIEVQTPDGGWMQIVFHSLQDVHSGSLGVLGIVRPNSSPPVVAVSDANVFARWEQLREVQRRRFGLDLLPARSDAGKRLLHQLLIAISADTPVLFVGEPGTGKLALAKVLHHRRRDDGWSATLDAEALSAEQQHEFLFGESGALRQAGPGRLIVRRLSRLALDVQQAFVEAYEKEDRRWQLLATDRDPPERTFAAGQLDASMHYLISRLVIETPPLRDRREDIADLAAIILERLQEERGGETPVPTAAALAVLERYDWPGNLREFAQALSSAAERAATGILDVPQLPPRVTRGTATPFRSELKKPAPLDHLLEQLERRMLRRAHAVFRGNKTKAAEHLGLSRARFIRRWEQLKMHEETLGSDAGEVEDDELGEES